MVRTSRLCSLLLISALFVRGTVAYAAFTDVPENSRYMDAFAYLQKQNIVLGFSDGTVRPGKSLSRVEGLASVLRMREQYAPQVVWFTENLPAMSLFTDMNQEEWYAPYVEVGFLEGIVKGMGDGSFRPAKPLTVEQALVMLKRAMRDESTIAFQSSDRITNVPNQWFTDAVSWAIDRNLVGPGERISLGTPITRGQFFGILFRLHFIESKGIYAYKNDPSTITQSLGTSDNAFAPPLASIPAAPIPFSITPLPFTPSDPFSLMLPPPQKTYGPAAPIPAQHEYASQKEFAITIPSLNFMDVTIGHPADPFSKDGILAPLNDGVGHLFAYPGNPGKTMIYGHSSGWPGDRSEWTKAFRRINELVSGDRVYINYEGKLHIYEVTRKQVIDAKDVSPFNDDGVSELILYTCWPRDSNKQRYLVHAMEVETVALR
ncbi:MAG TPA: sortase [Candidatus Peribacterales bacterium]|nr:sortase [Candidatus Peribacterales bacterium]